MKKFLLKIIAFSALLPLAYGAVFSIIIIFLPSLTTFINSNYRQINGHSHSKFKEIEEIKDQNINILFIGPSTTYRSFDPRIFREYCYEIMNLGTSAQTPYHTHLILQRYLKEINPQLLIYDVNPKFFMTERVEPTVDLISTLPIGLDTIIMGLKSGNITVLNTLAIKLINELFNLEINYTEPKVIGEDVYIGRGFVSKNKIVSKEELEKNRNSEPASNWKPLDDQLEYFEKNVKLIQNLNIPVLFIITPVNSNAYHRLLFSNSDFQKYIRQHGPFIDYNEHISLNDSLHFYDATVHLNQDGVNFFNRFILENDDFFLKSF